MVAKGMIPAVRIPTGANLPSVVEIKLKPDWQFDAARRVFVSDGGEKFAPRGELPKASKIVHKTPQHADAARKGQTLSAAERSLLSYLQVILPAGHSAAEVLKTIRQWPGVAEVSLPPEISLPGAPGSIG